jgi:3-deoxy-D-manno-octulosonate 8-phosphate phosphatase KdsC-like HAD superfamily phosphatase
MKEIACFFNTRLDPDLFPAPGLSFATANASPEQRKSVDYVFENNGGQGVLQAVADLITAD